MLDDSFEIISAHAIVSKPQGFETMIADIWNADIEVSPYARMIIVGLAGLADEDKGLYVLRSKTKDGFNAEFVTVVGNKPSAEPVTVMWPKDCNATVLAGPRPSDVKSMRAISLKRLPIVEIA